MESTSPREAAPPISPPQCAKCSKPASATLTLKRCAKCRIARYCSRQCQTADWKQHKKTCVASQASSANLTEPGPSTNTNTTSNAHGASSSPLKTPVPAPFHKLHDGTWLHGRADEDVFQLLIDAYRLRVEDQYKFTGDVDDDSIYGGAASGIAGFQRFLADAEKSPNLLPTWWSPAKAQQCLAVGRQSGWGDLRCAIEKGDIIEHYGVNTMPMQLRMFTEKVWGLNPGAAGSGDSMCRLQMEMERGAQNGQSFFSSLLSLG